MGSGAGVVRKEGQNWVLSCGEWDDSHMHMSLMVVGVVFVWMRMER